MTKQQIKQRVGLKDIARKADVSVSAVSMALADHPRISVETRQRIQEISQQMGYVRKRARSWQIIEGDIKRSWRFGILCVVEKASDKSGYDTMIHAAAMTAPHENVRLELASFEEFSTPYEQLEAHAIDYVRGLDGLIVSGRVSHALLTSLMATGTPVVIVGHLMGDPRLLCRPVRR